MSSGGPGCCPGGGGRGAGGGWYGPSGTNVYTALKGCVYGLSKEHPLNSIVKKSWRNVWEDLEKFVCGL